MYINFRFAGPFPAKPVPRIFLDYEKLFTDMPCIKLVNEYRFEFNLF